MISIGQAGEKYTVLVNLYQPISDSESELLEEILMSQIEFYLTNSASWSEDKIIFNNSPKKIVSNLNELVKADVRFHKYKALSDFKGFSNTVRKKVENISDRNYNLSASGNLSVDQFKSTQYDHQIGELISIVKTELYVFGEKDVYVLTTEVYPDLTQEEKDQLIKEIEEFQDGDLLAPLELTYQEILLEDDSGSHLGEPGEKDLADKIFELLAENSQRLERLESELIQLQISDSGGGSSFPENEKELFDQLPSSMDFYFNIGSSRLSTATLLQLNEIVEILARAESVKVVITGFTDKSGSSAANLELSKKRARAVKKFMRDSGMAEDRFIINYYGESRSDGFSNEDRRVEIKFFL